MTSAPLVVLDERSQKSTRSDKERGRWQSCRQVYLILILG